jgi:site-specific recombinase XerD
VDGRTFRALLKICPASTFTSARRQVTHWLRATIGMRLKELAGLMLADLDWKGGTVRIRQRKGQKDRRVPFHRNAQRAVLRYLSCRKDSFPDLWMTEERRPLSYGGFAVDLKRLVTLAGLRGVVKDACHIFRRTWAASAVRQGIPRQFIIAAAGWSTPAMQEEGAVDAFRDFDPFGGAGCRTL